MDATHAKKHRGVDHAVGGRTGGGVIETGRVFTKTQGRASLKLTEALFLAESLTSGAETIRSDKPGRLNLTDRNLAWATYCEQLLASEQAKNDTIRRYCEPLSTLERIYSASLVYALAQPPARRKRLAMFFTPPRLSEYVLDRVEKFGVDFQSDRFIDPAAGGASFIGPIAHRKLTKGAAPDSILDTVFGVEIDPGLADFARAAARSVVGIDATPMVETGDGLKLGAEASFDCVIGNPPYRVLSPHQRRRMPAWAKSTLANYANLYALFILRSLQLLRDGGTMALLIPTSFITGMYFSSLRAHISSHAEVLAIDTIAQRKEFFRDVSQDVCLLVCRKTSAPQSHCASARAVGRDLNWVASEDYEISPGAPDPSRYCATRHTGIVWLCRDMRFYRAQSRYWIERGDPTQTKTCRSARMGTRYQTRCYSCASFAPFAARRRKNHIRFHETRNPANRQTLNRAPKNNERRSGSAYPRWNRRSVMDRYLWRFLW